MHCAFTKARFHRSSCWMLVHILLFLLLYLHLLYIFIMCMFSQHQSIRNPSFIFCTWFFSFILVCLFSFCISGSRVHLDKSSIFEIPRDPAGFAGFLQILLAPLPVGVDHHAASFWNWQELANKIIFLVKFLAASVWPQIILMALYFLSYNGSIYLVVSIVQGWQR